MAEETKDERRQRIAASKLAKVDELLGRTTTEMSEAEQAAAELEEAKNAVQNATELATELEYRLATGEGPEVSPEVFEDAQTRKGFLARVVEGKRARHKRAVEAERLRECRQLATEIEEFGHRVTDSLDGLTGIRDALVKFFTATNAAEQEQRALRQRVGELYNKDAEENGGVQNPVHYFGTETVHIQMPNIQQLVATAVADAAKAAKTKSPFDGLTANGWQSVSVYDLNLDNQFPEYLSKVKNRVAKIVAPPVPVEVRNTSGDTVRYRGGVEVERYGANGELIYKKED